MNLLSEIGTMLFDKAATPYPIVSKWITRPTGFITITNQEIDASEISWE